MQRRVGVHGGDSLRLHVAYVGAELESATLGDEGVGGRTPRFFALSPEDDVLFVANEGSDDITGFRVDLRTGALASLGIAAHTGSPVCILFNPVSSGPVCNG